MLPILAGLGALMLMGNPPRKVKRRRRRNPFWADAHPTINGKHPYRFSFNAGGKRHSWIRYGTSMEQVFDLAKKAARRDYGSISSPSIESPQRENPRFMYHGGRELEQHLKKQREQERRLAEAMIDKDAPTRRIERRKNPRRRNRR